MTTAQERVGAQARARAARDLLTRINSLTCLGGRALSQLAVCVRCDAWWVRTLVSARLNPQLSGLT